MALFQPDPSVMSAKIERLIKQLKTERIKAVTLEAHITRLDADIAKLWTAFGEWQIGERAK